MSSVEPLFLRLPFCYSTVLAFLPTITNEDVDRQTFQNLLYDWNSRSTAEEEKWGAEEKDE